MAATEGLWDCERVAVCEVVCAELPLRVELGVALGVKVMLPVCEPLGLCTWLLEVVTVADALPLLVCETLLESEALGVELALGVPVEEGVWLCVRVGLGVALCVRVCAALGVGDGEGLPEKLGVTVSEPDCVPLPVRAWLAVPVAVSDGDTLGVAPWLNVCEIVGVDETVPMLPVRLGVRVSVGVRVTLLVKDGLCEDVWEGVKVTEALRVDDGVRVELGVAV